MKRNPSLLEYTRDNDTQVSEWRCLCATQLSGSVINLIDQSLSQWANEGLLGPFVLK